jgi:hypothetical protein
MLPQQTLEANGAKIVLAKSLNLFRRMNLAPALLELAYLIITHCILI